MQFATNRLFKNTCHIVIFIFYVQILQPPAFYYAHFNTVETFPDRHTHSQKALLDWLIPAAHAADELPVDPLLASTPDADITDPFIIEKAAELGNDPEQIFAFVRDEIGFESYVGSLRGARGTLWSKAGNALDQASLLIALLRANGLPAQYAQGTLSDADVKELIQSMFDPVIAANSVGYIPERFERADPVNDPQLIAEVKQHWWVQLADGSELDPSFTDGLPRTAVSSNHVEVPDTKRHKVTIRLRAEYNKPLTGFSEIIPLEHTFNTVAVYGKALSIGHFVNTDENLGLFGFGDKSYTYSPYIVIEDNDEFLDNNELLRGDDYQEFFSNLFSIANSFITRLTLEMEVNDPGKPADIRSRDLLDRIGIAARRGLADVPQFNSEQPAFTEFDLTTLYITPGFVEKEFVSRLQTALQATLDEIEPLNAQIAVLAEKDPAQISAEDRDLVKRYTNLNRQIIMTGGAVIAGANQVVSDIQIRFQADNNLTKAYYDTPRLTLHENRIHLEGETSKVRQSLDLRRNHIRAIPFPRQNTLNVKGFNLAKGFVDSLVEHFTLEQLVTNSTQDSDMSASPVNILISAGEQGILPVRLRDAADISSKLEALALSAEAKSRISLALRNGYEVKVPEKMVDINGLPAIAWWEVNPATGEAIIVSEDGGHNSLSEYLVILLLVTVVSIPTIGFLGSTLQDTFDNSAESSSYNELQSLLSPPSPSPSTNEPGPYLQTGGDLQGNGYQPQYDDFTSHYIQSSGSIVHSSPGSIIDFIGTDNEILSLLSLPSQETNGDILSATGMQIETVIDQVFVVKINHSQIPSAFRVRITNSGNEGIFNLSGATPEGWNLLIARDKNPIPAGITGEISVFLQPQPETALPAPGALLPFSLTVSRADNPADSLTQNMDFEIPEFMGLIMESSSPSNAVTRGDSVTSDLILTSVGNITASNVVLSIEAPSSLMVTGLSSSVDINAGDSLPQVLTLTPDASLPLNTTLTATITATFGELPDGSPQTASTQITVTVVTEEALTTLETANRADEIGRPQLSNTLNSIARTITDLSQTPDNEALQSRLEASFNSLIEQLNGDALTPFIPGIEGIRTIVSDGTDIPAALVDFSNLATDLGQVLQTDSNALPFDLTLGPNNITALPETPSHFNLILRNNSSQTAIYDLALSTLPASVTGGLNVSSVTLAPGQSTLEDGAPAAFVTLTQSAQQLVAFDFSVNVSLQGGNGLARTAHGAFTTRDEILKILNVSSNPGFTDPGGQVNITARLFNSANQVRDVLASYRVIAPDGSAVFNSNPALIQLTTLDSLQTIDLGALDTSGFAIGSHQIHVSITDADGLPVPGATGQSALLVGSPVNAFLTADPQTVSPGDHIVATQLHLDNLLAPITQTFSLLGQANTIATKSVALQGEIAYACGAEDVSVVDIADPENPQILSTFADDLIDGSILTHCISDNNHLFVFWQINSGQSPMHLLIFNLDDTQQPQLVSDTEYPNRFVKKPFIQGTTLFVSSAGIGLVGTSPLSTFGNLLAFDISDPVNPVLIAPLYTGSADGDGFYKGGGIALRDQYILQPSTSCQPHGLNCAGRLLTIDSSDPSNMSVLGSLRVGGSSFLTDIGAQGNLAVLASSNGGIPSPVDFGDPDKTTGNLMISTLDISDPLLPKIFKTITTDILMAGLSSSVVPLGNSLFAIGFNRDTNGPVIIIVDANDPENPVISNFPVLNFVAGMVSDGDFLYAASSGLKIYDLGNAFGTQISAQLRIPNNSVLAGTQNLSLRGGIVLNQSSISFLPQGRFAENSVDDDLFSQWWTSSGDVVNQGASPFYEIIFPESVTVDELNIFGNRTFSGGFTVEAGIFQLYDDQDNELYNSGEAVLTLTDAGFKDVFVNVPSVSGVKRARFSFTQDSGPWAGFSEFQVIGRVDDLSNNPFVNAFDPPPADIISGEEFTTFSWDFSYPGANATKTVNWQSIINGLQAGEAREIVLGGTVDFTTPAGDSGQFELAPLFVSSAQVLSLAPASQTVLAGNPSDYILTLKNPTNAQVNYDLSIQGIPAEWVDLPASVTVPAGASIDQSFTLQTGVQASSGENGFVISATTDSGTLNVVNGIALLSAVNAGGLGVDIESFARGVITNLTPANIIAGQGNSVRSTVRVTNTGNVSDIFDLSFMLPAGVSGEFSQTSIEVPPGLDNFREVALTLTPQPGTAPGNLVFSINAVSTNSDTVSDSAQGTLQVVPQGLALSVNPESGVPGGTFEITLTNTGMTEDTFDLVTGGPLGPFAKLGLEAITLAAGTSQSLPLTLEQIDFALPGNLDLAVVATSRSNEAVSAHISTQISIAEITGISAQFQPRTATLLEPGAQTFVLFVENTGNLEDGYSATIINTSGPVTASINGLDGLPAQQLPAFQLPGLSSGAIVLDTVLEEFGSGTVTVLISSSSDASISVTATAFITTEPVTDLAPVADAGKDRNVKIGERVVLNGSNSYDPEGALLSFNWTFSSDVNAMPNGSLLNDDDIQSQSTPAAVFTPDQPGIYTLYLLVDDGVLSHNDSVSINVHSANVPPNTEAGSDQYVAVGDSVALNGSQSVDPDNDANILSFVWTFDNKPVGSNAEITGATSAEASFEADVVGLYKLILTTSDGQAEDIDQLLISATDDNLPPNADAGIDTFAAVGQEIILNGTASVDPDDGPVSLSHQWRFVFVPVGSNLSDSDIVDAETATARFIPDVTGRYLLRDEVFDGLDLKGDNVMLTGVTLAFDMPPTPVCDTTQMVVELDTLELTMQASGSAIDQGVQLQVADLPDGAEFSALHIINNNSVFRKLLWKPVTSDIGLHAIQFMATDDTGQVENCVINIEVLEREIATDFEVTGELDVSGGRSFDRNVINSGKITAQNRIADAIIRIGGNYTGNNGKLLLDVGTTADTLLITGNTFGHTTVMINNIGLPANAGARILVISVTGTSSGSFTLDRPIHVGNVVFKLEKQGNNWYLVSKMLAEIKNIPTLNFWGMLLLLGLILLIGTRQFRRRI